MPLFATDDGLTVTQEGKNVRATSGPLNYLFVGSDKAAILSMYRSSVAMARDYFGPRWRSVRGANITADDFNDLTQEVTLHWMYFYVINRLPVQISNTDWGHPQTHRIVQKIVERRFTGGSEEATVLCAHLTGLSRDGFLKWREGDERFLNR
jgi:hypothetical protein